MNIFTQFFSKKQQEPEAIKSRVRRDFLRREAAVGRQVFGPIPEGHDREFFRIDSRTWIWQETWKDSNGAKRTRHTKYNIRDREIVKSVNGGTYERLTLGESKNFKHAVHEYTSRVKKEVYQTPFALK